MFDLFESGCFTQVLLYLILRVCFIYLDCPLIIVRVVIFFCIKIDFIELNNAIHGDMSSCCTHG